MYLNVFVLHVKFIFHLNTVFIILSYKQKHCTHNQKYLGSVILTGVVTEPYGD